jgi:hypothetical protein
VLVALLELVVLLLLELWLLELWRLIAERWLLRDAVAEYVEAEELLLSAVPSLWLPHTGQGLLPD